MQTPMQERLLLIRDSHQDTRAVLRTGTPRSTSPAPAELIVACVVWTRRRRRARHGAFRRIAHGQSSAAMVAPAGAHNLVLRGPSWAGVRPATCLRRCSPAVLESTALYEVREGP
jgi:hypothetical protein